METSSGPRAVEFLDVSKSFGEHQVLKGVSFAIDHGEVIALMGENGAGKSTLMRILAGAYSRSSYEGRMLLGGEEAAFRNVRDAKHAGIAMIHQELGLFNDLSVAENLLLEEVREKNPFRIPWKTIFTGAQTYLDSLGFSVDAKATIRDLSTGKRQLVEIARALRAGSSILILDEPTSALTEPEAQKLFAILKKLQAEGKAIFYVSHRMDEISEVADRVVVLRDGVIAGIDRAKELSRDQIIRWMVGRDMTHIYPKTKTVTRSDRPLFAVHDVRVENRQTGQALVSNASFELWPGEILGLGGLMGAGRSELAMAIYGAFGANGPWHQSLRVEGAAFFEGEPARWKTPAEAQKFGVAMLTEDRKNTGLLLNRPAAENMSLSVAAKLSAGYRLGAMRRGEERALVDRLAGELKIRGPGLEAEVELYSGGNQQKVALAKCLALKPKLLILDEPTRGVDIGAKLEIYEIMKQLTEQGVGILLISSEMPELLGLSHRVVVLRQGEISGVFEKQEQLLGYDPELIMHAASI